MCSEGGNRPRCRGLLSPSQIDQDASSRNSTVLIPLNFIECWPTGGDYKVAKNSPTDNIMIVLEKKMEHPRKILWRHVVRCLRSKIPKIQTTHVVQYHDANDTTYLPNLRPTRFLSFVWYDDSLGSSNHILIAQSVFIPPLATDNPLDDAYQVALAASFGSLSR